MSKSSGRDALELFDLPPGDFASIFQLTIAAHADRYNRTGKRRPKASDDLFGVGALIAEVMTLGEEV
jgi:hypothetical protein